ncbi:hypothetical protein MYU51_016445 [Penicillium brevicompactum]
MSGWEGFFARSVSAEPASVDHPQTKHDCEHIDRFSPPSTAHDSTWRASTVIKERPCPIERVDSDPSRPYPQWLDQVADMEDYILRKPRFGINARINARLLARCMIHDDWKGQGIWMEGWWPSYEHKWMHEKSEDKVPVKGYSFVMDSWWNWPEKSYEHPNGQPDIQQLDEQRQNYSLFEPFYPFIHQLSNERERFQTDRPDEATLALTAPDINTTAYENVKKLWIEKAIWEEHWGILPGMRWMHEGSSDTKSESRATPDTVSKPDTVSELQEPKLELIQSDVDTSLEDTGRSVEQKKNYEPSRPFYQFMHQVSKERERFQIDHPDEATLALTTPNVNTIAYENVKKIWVERTIWNEKWGILPGMRWKHEEPVEMKPTQRDPRPKPTDSLRQAERRREDALQRWLADTDADTDLDPETPKRRNLKRTRSEASLDSDASSSGTQAVRSTSTWELGMHGNWVDGRRRSKRLAKSMV